MIAPTAAQLEIQNAVELDILVIAPAGCGKTEALALRAAALIERGKIEWPQRVLVTTFTNRARDNIMERLRQYVTSAIMRERVAVANFHGLAARIYRAHGNVIGLDTSLRLPESDWVGAQCRNLGLGFKESGVVQGTLRRIKQQPLDDAAIEQALVDDEQPIALEIERRRVAEGRLTYDDLPRLAELILANDRVADLYQSHFGCVLVDEFQDLTPQQLRLVGQVARGRATYAGDVGQGIYGFAGAAPSEVLRRVEADTSRKVTFTESHRSSPAVLDMVNALCDLTGGQRLTSAQPAAWPSGGFAGTTRFATTADEAGWARMFAQLLLERGPVHRVAVIARTASRRRFADEVFSRSGLPYHRWDDPVLDTETAKVISTMLANLNARACLATGNPMHQLRSEAGVDSIQDPSTRESIVDALGWCCDLLQDGAEAPEIRARIKLGGKMTLLNVPGVHLLTGHVGKGQQFDWVVVVGAEDGCIPDFRATDEQALAEEARVLAVMLSRARHGVAILNASRVESANGTVWSKNPSRFLSKFASVPSCLNRDGMASWLARADWGRIAER